MKIPFLFSNKAEFANSQVAVSKAICDYLAGGKDFKISFDLIQLLFFLILSFHLLH